jgi:hypothetical protein
MKQVLSAALISMFVVSSGCQKEEQIPPAPQLPSSVSQRFAPSADSTIKPAQLAAWVTCSRQLDSLSVLYQDSFATDDATLRLRHQNDFSQSQNTICLSSGLSGGYNEYLWVLSALSNPRNKALRDSFSIASH